MERNRIAVPRRTLDSTFSIEHFASGTDCYDTVKAMAESYWARRKDHPAAANYRFDSDEPWTLGEMLRQDAFNLGVSVLFQNGEPNAFAGIRSFDNGLTLCMGRYFRLHSPLPYGGAYLLPLHIEVSKAAGFRGTCVSVNEYNDRLLKYCQEALPKMKGDVAKEAHKAFTSFTYVGVREVNHVPQHVFELLF